MTTDITELAQMKGQKVEGSYYLAECTDCGKMYPSNKLNGGEPLFSGDYGECYCPHCNADDAAIGDCGDTAAKAWNYQQDRIDALVEALEKAQSANAAQDDHINQQQDRIDTLEKRNAELGREVIRLQSLKTVNAALQEAESEFHRGYSCGHKDASLESRTVTVKLTDINEYLAEVHDKTLNRAFRLLAEGVRAGDVAAMRAAGIKVEAE